ncbi:MAG TPA: tripartite tricarboxylate transporter TctB family protein [candidate division Zixibacteria bacterium]|nr:tripartite tricarboxylate transporter TctB family protein [candidate division Zixibacteria bacterium]
MKNVLSLRFLFAFAVALVAAYALYASLFWPFRTALFPRVLGVPLLILAIVEMSLNAAGVREHGSGYAVDFEFTADVAPEVARRRTLALFGWLAGFFGLILLVGFPPAVALFVLFYLRLAGGESWSLSVLLTGLAWAFMEGLFNRLLHVPFPQGWLFSLIQG